MNEASLKRALVQRLRARLPEAAVWRHEDRFTGGIPDISVSCVGRSCWIEVKYRRTGRTAQLSSLQRRALDRTGGLLVTYVEDKRLGRLTEIKTTGDRNYCKGFDHDAVCDEVERRLLTGAVR